MTTTIRVLPAAQFDAIAAYADTVGGVRAGMLFDTLGVACCLYGIAYACGALPYAKRDPQYDPYPGEPGSAAAEAVHHPLWRTFLGLTAMEIDRVVAAAFPERLLGERRIPVRDVFATLGIVRGQ